MLRRIPSRGEGVWRQGHRVRRGLGGQRCEAIDPGCDRLGGKASYTAAQVEACVAGLQQVTCRARVDPFTFDVEAQVPACKAMDLADARPAARGADTTVTASR